jgi:hypothetical protein
MRKILIFISGFAAMIIPASAQISTADAMLLCRNQVRQDATARFGSSNIEFRSTSLKEHAGVQNRIEGQFTVARAEGPQMHTFACSVDLVADKLQRERIDSQDIFNSTVGSASRAASPEAEANSSAGAANTTTYTDAQVLDTCRKVVRGKIYDHGYIGADFDSISIDNTRGGGWVVGEATGETGGHENEFNFSCEVNRTTGAVESLEVSGR